MQTIAVKMKLHRMSFQQQGYLGLKLNISQALSLWNPSRRVSGHPSLFPSHLFSPSGQGLSPSRWDLQYVPSGSLFYFSDLTHNPNNFKTGNRTTEWKIRLVGGSGHD